MAEILEALMVISFGISWPTSIAKAYKARTAKGTSPAFLSMILFGYICGIASKICSNSITYVFVFYILNAVMVTCNLVVYFRNRQLDKAQETALHK